ncbi:ATP-dependent helicase C-terminal domain-containing protein, partial [Streptomyces rectiviolaceus]
RQRAGRAGREAPGAVYRCWAEAEDARLPRFPAPEIKLADLAAFALQAACWGDPDASGLALLDPPPGGAMAAARAVLTAVGAVSPESGRVTERGTRMARVGLHPRLARALLDAVPLVGARRAAEVVALLSEEPPREYGDDIAAAWRAARQGGDGYAARWRTEVRRLTAAAGESPARNPGSDANSRGDEHVAGLVAALAYPERVAHGRADGTYLMVNGTRAEVRRGSALTGAEWITVAVADRPVGSGHARVLLGGHIDGDVARSAAAPLYSEGDEVAWADGDLVARHVERLGAVELAVRPLKKPAPGLVREGLLAGLGEEGTSLLNWSQGARELRERLAFLHRRLGAPWPDVSESALHARVDEWLEPELSKARRRADLRRIDAGQALNRLLPWATGEATRLDALAPERVAVPSGSRIRIDYSDPEQPVLAVKLQEMFGLADTPRVADGSVPVLVHLLSPAGRPAAVTADLASFWRDGYRAVRAELRGRYPKHPWPEDPAAAVPTRFTNARLKGRS